MPEKKTFRNPNGFGRGSTYDIRGEQGYYSQLFHGDEWDMEVTFTKKEKPFVPGYYRAVTNTTLVKWFTSPQQQPEIWELVKVTPVVSD